jgi:hypothetical protein
MNGLNFVSHIKCSGAIVQKKKTKDCAIKWLQHALQ